MLRFILFWTAALFLCSCAFSEKLLHNDLEQDEEPEHSYTLIYYIHGDSDYIYHDTSGKKLRADEEVLKDAADMASLAGSGEIFIFHQRSQKLPINWLKLPSGTMYHYRSGELVGTVKYHTGVQGDGFLSKEATLFANYRSSMKSNSQRLYFAFYGHEIPYETEFTYHASHNGTGVGIDTFQAGIGQFLSNDSEKFELVLLSSCSNGSPEMANALMPFARKLVASPQNLHLSYIRPLPFILLEPKPEIPTYQLAEKIAESAFGVHTRTLQTTVTISLYDLEKTAPYLSELSRDTALQRKKDADKLHPDASDCANKAFFDESAFTDGVHTWYRKSRFDIGRENHSGWGCMPH